jgi:hypothetical protein
MYVQLQSCMGQRTSSFPERKEACDGIKEVREPMQGIFSVSASNERIDSANSSGTLVGLEYMLHEQVRPF